MRILFFIFLFLVSETYAQEVKIKFDLHDKNTLTGIDSVQLYIYTSPHQTVFKGWVKNQEVIQLRKFKGLELNIVATLKDYKKLIKSIDLSKKNFRKNIENNLPITVLLSLDFKGYSIVKVDISGNYKPQIKFSSQQVSVSDYVIISKDTLLLLAYPKRLKKSSELLWWVDGRIVNRLTVPEEAKELVTDYRNRIFLRCISNDYMVKNGADLKLAKVNRKDLDNYILPILDTFRQSNLYYTTFNKNYPAFDFYRLAWKDTSQHILHHIEDKEMMEQYRAEFKWVDVRTKLWAWDMESITGIDRRIWVGANIFTKSIYWEPPYGNLFIKGDTVFVFDFYKNKMYCFNAGNGQKMDSIPISFQNEYRKTGWGKKMIQDPITKKIYTLFNKGGYIDLYQVNIKNGQIEKKYTLFYRYPEDVQLYNGSVYYIYRPFESAQKKYLYIEGLHDPKRNLKGQNRFSTRNDFK